MRYSYSNSQEVWDTSSWENLEYNGSQKCSKEWSACLEAGLQERGATRTLERFIGNSFSLYFVSRRFSRCSATAVHMYAGLILGYNTVCGERYRWLSTELVWCVVLRFRLTKLRLVAVKLHQTMNIDINSPSYYNLFAI